MTTEIFFLPGQDGQRLCLYHPAVKTGAHASRGRVVYVHPLAEEMNKSRRMAARQSRSLASAGFDVLQIDLLGCGDSSGDFCDASWAAWLEDVVSACLWLRARTDADLGRAKRPPLWLWGLRAGCLLAAQAAIAIPDEPCSFLFWAPPSSGKTLLQQFLRLKAAADLTSGNSKIVMDALRNDLANDRAVEIAGYVLAPALAIGLEQSTLKPPRTGAGASRVEWFELSTRADAGLSPVATKIIADWAQAGYVTRSYLVPGPSFWQTSEIEDAPELVTATTAALLEAGTA